MRPVHLAVFLCRTGFCISNLFYLNAQAKRYKTYTWIEINNKQHGRANSAL